MPKATIILDVTRSDERVAVEAWFENWGSHLSFVSENQGCGCCVDIWDVEGTDEALAAIPSATRSFNAAT